MYLLTYLIKTHFDFHAILYFICIVLFYIVFCFHSEILKVMKYEDNSGIIFSVISKENLIWIKMTASVVLVNPAEICNNNSKFAEFGEDIRLTCNMFLIQCLQTQHSQHVRVSL